MSGSPVLSWRPLGNGKYVPQLEIPEEGTSLEAVERELIEMALKQSGGNQTRAARLLGISRDTLRYRIKKFELTKRYRKGLPSPGPETKESPQASSAAS